MATNGDFEMNGHNGSGYLVENVTEKRGIDGELEQDIFHDCPSQPPSPSKGTVTSESGDCVERAVNDREDTPSIDDSSKETSPAVDDAKLLDKKNKRREDKNIEHVLKALTALSSPEEKLAALCKKYTELLEETRQHAVSAKSSQKRVVALTRERDNLQADNSKLILARSKLESLCRELQRHNKLIKEESLARQRDEEEKRKEVANRFQTTIGDIQCQMESHSKRNDQLQEDNRELTDKLSKLVEQYEKRDEHIQRLIHQKELENQLLNAKLAQSQLLLQQEQEKSAKEKQMLLEKLIESKTRQEEMIQSENHLKVQLAVYTDKYSEFESTLTKSNEVFSTFKSEMDKMSKKIKTLEKECLMYKQRSESANRALIEMVEQKQVHDRLLDTTTKKCQKLESLCRALQGRAAPDGERKPPIGQVNEVKQIVGHAESSPVVDHTQHNGSQLEVQSTERCNNDILAKKTVECPFEQPVCRDSSVSQADQSHDQDERLSSNPKEIILSPHDQCESSLAQILCNVTQQPDLSDGLSPPKSHDQCQGLLSLDGAATLGESDAAMCT